MAEDCGMDGGAIHRVWTADLSRWIAPLSIPIHRVPAHPRQWARWIAPLRATGSLDGRPRPYVRTGVMDRVRTRGARDRRFHAREARLPPRAGVSCSRPHPQEERRGLAAWPQRPLEVVMRARWFGVARTPLTAPRFRCYPEEGVCSARSARPVGDWSQYCTCSSIG